MKIGHIIVWQISIELFKVFSDHFQKISNNTFEFFFVLFLGYTEIIFSE